MTGMTFENLTIGYRLRSGKTKIVARGLSATLESGQLTCLLGRNGTGKSTLLRTLAGLQEPLQPQGNSSLFSWRKNSNQIAVVLTDPLDIHHIMVEEVVGLGRTPYTNFWGTLRENDKAIVAESLQLVGIMPLAQHDVGSLSDGERQKVMIAKALAQQTSIIILDEPTAFLDYPSKHEIMALLQLLAYEHGKTILLSTHDVEIAEQYADQIWFMDGSRLLTGTEGAARVKQYRADAVATMKGKRG